MGRNDEAFAASERLRARSYLDLLSREGQDRGLAPADRRRATELKQRIRALERALDAEARAPGTVRRNAAGLFSKELAAAEKECDDFLAGLRKTDPGLTAAWLTLPDASSIQAALPLDAALIEFVAGGDNVVVFVLTRERLPARVTRLPRRDLAAKVALVRDLVLRRGDEWRPRSEPRCAPSRSPREGRMAGRPSAPLPRPARRPPPPAVRAPSPRPEGSTPRRGA